MTPGRRANRQHRKVSGSAPTERVVQVASGAVELGADGSVVLKPAGPCLGCDCCKTWTRHLATLRDHIREHTRGERRRKACFAECLVCGEVGWQATTVVLEPAEEEPDG
jgi:hypothetical protein